MLLLLLGTGLLGTVVAIRAELAGFGIGVTGVVMAMYYVGFLGGAWIVPRVIGGVGHIRVYAALASLCSSTALIHALAAQPVLWAAMRLLSGFAMAGLYIVAEAWLNDAATNDTRGRLLSIYMIAVMGGIAGGQVLLAVVDTSGAAPFIVASVLISLAVLPITLSVRSAPEFRWVPHLPVRKIWQAAPLGVVGGFGAGLAHSAVLALGAVYGARAGMNVARIALFMGLLVAGSVVFQWPIGALSDRIHRRRAVLLVTALATGLAVVLAMLDPLGNAVLVAVFVFGGLTFPVYSVSLSHINDHVPVGTAISVSALFVFVAGVGAIVGPLVASAAIAAAGPPGLFWALAVEYAAIAVFAVGRISVRRGLPISAQRRFVQVPARTGALVIHLARLGRRNGRGTNLDATRSDGQPARR